MRGLAKLTFLEAGEEDDGEYTVKATNKAGEETLSFHVSVNCE